MNNISNKYSFEVIEPFKKLPHFVKRQNERNISDDLINSMLEKLKDKKISKNTFAWFKNENFKEMVNHQQDLLIRINKKALLTCYFTNDANYILREHHKCNIVII
jgi:hypothetical protein